MRAPSSLIISWHFARGQTQSGSDFTQTATRRSFLMARTGWVSTNIGSTYCQWEEITFIGCPARKKVAFKINEGMWLIDRVYIASSSGILESRLTFGQNKKCVLCFLFWNSRPRIGFTPGFVWFPSCMRLWPCLPSCPVVPSVSLCHKHVILYSVSLPFSPRGSLGFFPMELGTVHPPPQLLSERSVTQVHDSSSLDDKWKN